MAKFKKADGTEVDLGAAVTDDQITALMTIAADVSAATLAGVAGTIETVVRKEVAPLVQRLDQYETATPTPKAQPKGKAGAANADGAEGDEAPAWAKGLIDTVGTLSKERSKAETERRCNEYLARTRPNMTPAARTRLAARLVAAAPADEAGLKATTEEVLAEWADAGVDVAKLNTASPAAEGAKSPGEGGDLAAQKAANMKKLREQGPGGLRPVKTA